MTFEARVLFVVLFFSAWAFLGLLAWASVAVLRRGRGALLALPVSLASACTFGVFVPLVGLRDATGFFVSLALAVLGSFLGYALVIALARRFGLAPEPAVQAGARPPRESP